MNVFIDVLRLLALQKLCIWTLEDVQNADAESAELIHHIAQARIPLVLILTYQSEELVPKELRTLLPAATRIQLYPFTEADTAEYVSETLHRDTEYILPLVSYAGYDLHAKTNANNSSGRSHTREVSREHILYQRDIGYLLPQAMCFLLLEGRMLALRPRQGL